MINQSNCYFALDTVELWAIIIDVHVIKQNLLFEITIYFLTLKPSIVDKNKFIFGCGQRFAVNNWACFIRNCNGFPQYRLMI